MPSLTKGVGIVSNIKYTGTDLEKNFNNGLGHPQWDRVVRHQLGYDAKDSARAVAELNTEGRVGLIVTVGGLTTAVAALNYSPNLTKPFVSLIGDTIPEFPGTIKDWFFGGMNLENFRRNPDRISRLADRGFQPGQICLLCNPKSATTPYETREWGGGRIYYAENLAQIQDAFTLFQRDGTLGAMIISSDGFFQDSKDSIKEAADQSGKVVCYPLQIYSEGGRPLPRRRSRRHGPMLATAYFHLGEKAALVISSGTQSTLDPVTTNRIKDD